MTPNTFFTRSPKLAFLRQLVQENSTFNYDRDDAKRVFEAIDVYCNEQLGLEVESGWMPPSLAGGAHLTHTPYHVFSAGCAIYADIATGLVEPVPFLASPLSVESSTAVQFEPTDHYRVMDRNRRAAPLTDILISPQSKVPVEWIPDKYGTPSLNPGIVLIGWHEAADSIFTAMYSGFLFLHLESKEVLNPMANFTTDEEQLFFSKPVDLSRLDRHQKRLVEFFGPPPRCGRTQSRNCPASGGSLPGGISSSAPVTLEKLS